MNVRVVEGDLLEQETDAIVNPWNRNLIPWWLLLPQGVSGAIKRRAGLEPFREVARFGPLALGRAVPTSAGRLPYRAIIHVAGINLLWRATPRSIQDSVRNACHLAESLGLRSLAFPLIGSGSGNFDPARAEALMLEALAGLENDLEVVIVRYRRS
jgi:O-acetyl-ADP-ribose deacetylase